MTCQELISFGNAAIQRICAQGLRKEQEPWTAGSKPCMARSPALSATLGRDLVSCQITECCQSPVMQCLRTCTQQAEACRSTYAHSLCLLAQPTRSQLWGGAAVPSFTISVFSWFRVASSTSLESFLSQAVRTLIGDETIDGNAIMADQTMGHKDVGTTCPFHWRYGRDSLWSGESEAWKLVSLAKSMVTKGCFPARRLFDSEAQNLGPGSP